MTELLDPYDLFADDEPELEARRQRRRAQRREQAALRDPKGGARDDPSHQDNRKSA
ncbi:hypothetical protein [Amycolatopsis nigrescens]|uniref:hypothetical protein n=1 Tax=Amycolatopsis nigrescens TaxID=381445 RepID=UPI0012F9E804|nr:hypothetical protein [Amycolatopsis nigrescens]